MKPENPAICTPEAARLALRTHYGYEAREVRAVPGGMSASAFSADHRFFLKLYDLRHPLAQRCVHTLKNQMAVLSLLARSPLGGQICAPIPTLNGSLLFSDGLITGTLFDWIDGTAIGFGSPMTQQEKRCLAWFSASLHSLSAEPFRVLCPKEDFTVHFAEELAGLLENADHLLPEPLSASLSPYRDAVLAQTGWLYHSAQRLRSSPPPFVLCHTDLHGGNLLRRRDGSLAVVDWENVQLAPREADLFLFCEEPYFPLFREPSDNGLLLYYLVRRDLEDLWEFCRTLLSGQYHKSEVRVLLGHTERIAAHTARLLTKTEGIFL